MKYIGVIFTTYESPFRTKPNSKVYYYKTKLDFEKTAAYLINAGDYKYTNPVLVVEQRNTAPDPSRDYKEITGRKVFAHWEPQIEPQFMPNKVYFNPKAGTTCVLWKNGDKTLVKCCENDMFDFEKGFAMATLKHIYGKGLLNKFFKEFVHPKEEEYYRDLMELNEIIMEFPN
jgi:hypothetical protein